MRTFQLVAIAVFCVALVSSQMAAKTSDIVGTWSAETEILLELDDEIVKVPRVMTGVIDKVDGALFYGRRMWKARTADPGNVAGTEVLSATEPFIGAIDSDGVTLRIVETDDPGIMFGEVLGPNELEITYMESYPHAVVYTVVLKRKTD